MMKEEHALEAVDRRASSRSALVVGLAAFAGSILPVVPFAFASRAVAVAAALVTGALSLFALGAFKARVTTGSPHKSGLVLALIGVVGAIAGYAVGALFG
jgi:predicted membrane protein (TIGR00267 family)